MRRKEKSSHKLMVPKLNNLARTAATFFHFFPPPSPLLFLFSILYRERRGGDAGWKGLEKELEKDERRKMSARASRVEGVQRGRGEGGGGKSKGKGGNRRERRKEIVPRSLLQ